MPNPRAHEIGQAGAYENKPEDAPAFPRPEAPSHGPRRGTAPFLDKAGPDIKLPGVQVPEQPDWYRDRIYSRGRSPDGLEVVLYTLQPATADSDEKYPLGPPVQVAGGQFGQRKVWLYNNSSGVVVFSQSRQGIQSGANIFPLVPGVPFDLETEAPIWVGNASTTAAADVFVTKTFWKSPGLRLPKAVTEVAKRLGTPKFR